MNVVLDFDGTITVLDTIGEIAALGLSSQKQKGQDLTAAWNGILKAYFDDSDKYARDFSPSEKERVTISQETAYLHGRRAIEAASLGRVGEAGIFKGLDEGILFRAGQEAAENGKVHLRPGFKEFMKMLRGTKASMFIVSVSWSASFIRGVIDQPGGITVIANEIGPDGKIVGPALLGRSNDQLATSKDKVEAMRHILVKEASGLKTSSSTPTPTPASMYFGDSTTDLECLLAVGGIVVSDNHQSSLLKTLRRLGYDVPHVAEGKSVICWARDFQEVLDCNSVLRICGKWERTVRT